MTNKLVAIALAVVLGMGLVGVMGTRAYASPDGDGGLDRMPWRAVLPDEPLLAAAGECPYNITVVSDRLLAAARQAAALPVEQRTQVYRAEWQKVHDGMTPACQAEMFWEAVALLKARQAHKYIRRDGTELWIYADPDGDNAADRALEAERTSVEAAAQYERDVEMAACACSDAAGYAYEMWQNINQMRNAIIAVAGLAIVTSAAYPGNVTLPQVRDMLMRMGVAFAALDWLAQTVFNTLSNGGSGSGGVTNGDPCNCGRDR